MQVRDLLAILAKRWTLIVACLLLVIAAAAVATMQMTPVYESRTRLYVVSDGPGAMASQTDLGTFVELMGSPILREPIREAAGVPEGTGFSINGSVAGSSPILSVQVRADNPATAKAVAEQVGPQLETIGIDYSPILKATGGSLKISTLVPANLPGQPVSPDLRNNLLMGALVGLALGVGIALLIHFLDTRVRTHDDVAALTDQPILGSLPRQKGDGSSLLMAEEPHGVAAEEYRRLRTNLQFVDVTTDGKHSFVVTSAMPGEGKTTTAANLARAFADSGSRVLLIDGDLRNPSVARTLGIEGAVGLTTVLLGRARIDDAIQRWQDTTLDILPAGPIPPNPSELLGSAATETLVNGLLAAYDMVIVDSPPINPVVDAVLLGRLTGGLLMVVSANKARKREVAAALKSLQTVDQPVAGIALNMVPVTDATYGSYYHYGHQSSKRRKAPAKSRRTKVDARRTAR